MRVKRFMVLGTVALSCLGSLPAYAFDAVDFQYNADASEELRANLEAVSLLAGLSSEEDTGPQDILAAARGDYTQLVEALYSQGYYGPVVRISVDGQEAASIPPFDAPDTIGRVVVRVETGQKFRFGLARVAPGAPDTDPTEGFASGERALAPVVRSAAQNAVDGWRAAGHAEAGIESQQITARHAEKLLDVDVRLDPGRRYRFGEVIVTTESAVKAPRIRQIAGIPQGEVFDPDAVDKAAERLREVGTFRSVTLEESPTEGETLDILVDVTDRKPRRIGAGVEVSSSDGLTLSGFWLHRNVFGGAERFRIEGEASHLGSTSDDIKPDYELSARFEKPAVYGADTSFYATASISREDEPDYVSDTLEFGIGVSQEFSDTLTGELGFTLSRSEVTDLYLPNEPTRTLDVFAMPTALTWDTRDVALDATEGGYIRIDAEPFRVSSDAPSGAENGFRFMLDARGYRGFLDDDRLVAALRFQLGALSGPDGASAPPDYLFYSGGGGTVRGQPYESLDATYDNGVELGGRSFIGLSGELRAGITDKIGVVAFYDTGYIGPESFYDDSGSWHAGAGLGVRYDTPVGPLRVDLAGPVSGDTGDGVQIYIGIGQAF
ncbi:autotransporter assembly complex protein TamA [Sagittula sp. SSi028]|uniref:autotransporter assembly complex protein TamA n=1 Tax=Sagittula sp. SSi028 TaxID=3400636 RepID=UPI003AF612FC